MKAAELTSLWTLKTLAGKAACSSLSGACHPRCHQVPDLREALGSTIRGETVVPGMTQLPISLLRLGGMAPIVAATGLLVWGKPHSQHVRACLLGFLQNSLFFPHPRVFAISEKG